MRILDGKMSDKDLQRMYIYASADFLSGAAAFISCLNLAVAEIFSDILEITEIFTVSVH